MCRRQKIPFVAREQGRIKRGVSIVTVGYRMLAFWHRFWAGGVVLVWCRCGFIIVVVEYIER